MWRLLCHYYLLPGAAGQVVTYDHEQRLFNVACEGIKALELNLRSPGMTLHTLRSKVPRRGIAEWLGHARPSCTCTTFRSAARTTSRLRLLGRNPSLCNETIYIPVLHPAAGASRAARVVKPPLLMIRLRLLLLRLLLLLLLLLLLPLLLLPLLLLLTLCAMQLLLLLFCMLKIIWVNEQSKGSICKSCSTVIMPEST